MIDLCSASSMQSSRRDLLKVGLNINISRKIKIRTTSLFFKIDLCSASSIESSGQDLLVNRAEHRFSLKNNQNTYYSLIFKERSMFSHINEELSPIPFEL